MSKGESKGKPILCGIFMFNIILHACGMRITDTITSHKTLPNYVKYCDLQLSLEKGSFTAQSVDR